MTRGQRAAQAFDTSAKAWNHAQRIGSATVVEDDRGNWWAVPLDRFSKGGVRLSGPWNTSTSMIVDADLDLEVDQVCPYGMHRPLMVRVP